MIEINSITDMFSIQLLEILGYYLLQFIIENYSLIIILSIFILIGVAYLINLLILKNSSIFNKKNIVNVICNTLIAYSLGVILIDINLLKVNVFLNLCFSVSILFICFFVFLFIKEVLIYRKSSKKILAYFLKFFQFIGLTYIFIIAAIDKFSFLNDSIILLFFIFTWMVLRLFSTEPVETKQIMVDEESDVEIENYNQLLPSRQREYHEIMQLLSNNNYEEPFAITLNGDWGVGKTSLVNVLLNELKQRGNYNIFIQPMVLDTTEKQMDYFFNQLNSILSANGIYTGNESPFKKYVNTLVHVINTINMRSIFRLNEIFDSSKSENSDLRDSKRLLEEDIRKLLSSSKYSFKKDKDQKIKKKIYIVVDDFDRVEEETYKNTLIFIKEIVNFKGINVIFLMDDRKLEQNKINREYMDKFVNTRYQLAKIEYDELFNHFIKNIKKEELKTNFIKQTSDIIKQKGIVYIQNIFEGLEGEIERINTTLGDLSNKKEQEEVVSARKQQLEADIKEVKQHIVKIREGVSNVRKLKKIIREIKNILLRCDQECENSSEFTINLNRIESIEELIVKLAIIKIIHAELIDQIIESNDTSNFILESNSSDSNRLFVLLFKDLRKYYYNEQQGLKKIIINEFCNTIIMNRSFSAKLLNELVTDNERMIAELDSDKEIEIYNIEGIKKYLSVIPFYNWDIGRVKAKKRTSRLIDLTFKAYIEKKVTFGELLELLSDSQRNPLINDMEFLSRLKIILKQTNMLEHAKDKRVFQYYLDQIETTIFLRYRGDILMIMNLLMLKDPRYHYENFNADYGDIFSLTEMIKSIKRFFGDQNKEIFSDLEYYKHWSRKAIVNVKKSNKNNKYISKAIVEYENKQKEFIDFLTLIKELKKELDNIQLKPERKFQEKLSYSSYDELKSEINEFYNFIVTNDNHIINFMSFYYSLLMAVERYSRKNEIETEVIEKLEEICIKITNLELEDGTDAKKTWKWIMVKMGEIEENMLGHKKDLIQRLLHILIIKRNLLK